MATNPAPITQQVIDENGLPTLPWTLFFNQNFEGDAGTDFAPEFVSLTAVGGAPTITARFFRLSQFLIYFRLTVTPVTNTSATAGTTYAEDLPFNVNADGFCLAVAGAQGGGTGIVQADTNRIYVPAWTTVTVPVTVLGICEAR